MNLEPDLRASPSASIQLSTLLHILLSSKLILSPCRGAGYQERCPLRLLPRALSGHNLHDRYQEEDPLLLLQPDCALHPDRLHGRPGLHAAAGLRRETVLR